jgi:uracil-DNA glycosylase
MIGFKTYLTARKELGWKNPTPMPVFSHGGVSALEGGVHIVSSYHPSQQNTQTGKLTEAMFDEVFRKARGLLG